MSAFIGDFVDQLLGILPSQTGIGNGASRDHVVANVLTAFQKIAFDHNTFYKLFQIGIVIAAVKDFTDDTDLFFILLSGIGMVYVNNDSRIFQFPLLI